MPSSLTDGIEAGGKGVSYLMRELLLDLVLPKTDQGVFIQWGIAAFFWLAVFVGTRKINKDVRTFIYGLAMLNIAWFAFRTLH